MLEEKPEFSLSSGNVFADLGVPNADEHLLKAQVVAQLHGLIKDQKLTQKKAAAIIGIKQPDLSNILNGHFWGFSVERLLRLLLAFDQDVEIRVAPRSKNSRESRISVTGQWATNNETGHGNPA